MMILTVSGQEAGPAAQGNTSIISRPHNPLLITVLAKEALGPSAHSNMLIGNTNLPHTRHANLTVYWAQFELGLSLHCQ